MAELKGAGKGFYVLDNKPVSEQVRSVLASLGVSNRSEMFHSCLTCNNWGIITEHCKLFNERPPLKVIVDGCKYWDDSVPF